MTDKIPSTSSLSRTETNKKPNSSTTSPNTSSSAAAAAKTSKTDTTTTTTILRRDNEEYKIVKKLPGRFPKRDNDIYITNKTDFKAQLERCKHLIRNFKQADQIVLHAMGPAINRFVYKLLYIDELLIDSQWCIIFERAINLSLRLQKEQPYLELSCFTSSIELEDDLIPLVDNLDISVQQRFISAVHIKISNPLSSKIQ